MGFSRPYCRDPFLKDAQLYFFLGGGRREEGEEETLCVCESDSFFWVDVWLVGLGVFGWVGREGKKKKPGSWAGVVVVEILRSSVVS